MRAKKDVVRFSDARHVRLHLLLLPLWIVIAPPYPSMPRGITSDMPGLEKQSELFRHPKQYFLESLLPSLFCHPV